jgi:hypothetical protein
MPPVHPKGLFQCLYTAVFLAGVLIATHENPDTNPIWAWMFLAIWPGLLFTTVFLVGASVGRVEVKPRVALSLFVYNEAIAFLWLFLAVVSVMMVAFWPATLAGLALLAWRIKTAPLIVLQPDNNGPILTNHPTISIRPSPPVKSLGPIPQSAYIRDEEKQKDELLLKKLQTRIPIIVKKAAE